MSESYSNSVEQIKLVQEKVSKAITEYLNTILDKSKIVTSNFYRLPYEEQRKNKMSYFRELKSYDDQVKSLEKLLYRFYSLIQSITHLGNVMESVIRVRTALEVISEQFEDSNIDYLEAKENVMGAYTDDVYEKLLSELNRIRSNIVSFITVLDQNGFSEVMIDGKSIYEYLSRLDNLSVDMVDFEYIDMNLKRDIQPDISLETQERLKVLSRYEQKVNDGDMSFIQKVDSRVFTSKFGFKPSRVVITGERAKESLLEIGKVEKQLEAIERALMVIDDNRSYQFLNTSAALERIRASAAVELAKVKKDFPQDDYDLIKNVIGEESREELMSTYASLYADLQRVTHDNPDSLERIQFLRGELMHLITDKQMSKEEIAKATKMGRVMLLREERKLQYTIIREELRRVILERLRGEYLNQTIEPSVVDSEINFYVTTAFLSKEERALESLKRHGYIDPGVTLEHLTENQRKALEIQMALEEKVLDALQKYLMVIGVSDGPKELVRESHPTKK